MEQLSVPERSVKFLLMPVGNCSEELRVNQFEGAGWTLDPSPQTVHFHNWEHMYCRHDKMVLEACIEGTGEVAIYKSNIQLHRSREFGVLAR